MGDAGRTQNSTASLVPWARITRAQFARAIAALPQPLRMVFELQALNGEPYDRIAARLHLSREAVGTYVQEARRLVRASLREGR
jgi:DNA-directed RNA polymerase specialized sigma24 family protein